MLQTFFVMGGASKGITSYYIYLRKAMCHRKAFLNLLWDFDTNVAWGDYSYSVEQFPLQENNWLKINFQAIFLNPALVQPEFHLDLQMMGASFLVSP